MTHNYKQVNGFIYEIDEDEITIAAKAVYSNTAGQLLVNQQVNGILVPTGSYQDVKYEDTIYIGIIFHNTISEEQLINVLAKDL